MNEPVTFENMSIDETARLIHAAYQRISPHAGIEEVKTILRKAARAPTAATHGIIGKPALYERLKSMTEQQRIELLDPICAALQGSAKVYDGCGMECIANRIMALAAIDLYQAWQQEVFNRE